MRTTILVDNTALFDRYPAAEHGFSVVHRGRRPADTFRYGLLRRRRQECTGAADRPPRPRLDRPLPRPQRPHRRALPPGAALSRGDHRGDGAPPPPARRAPALLLPPPEAPFPRHRRGPHGRRGAAGHAGRPHRLPRCSLTPNLFFLGEVERTLPFEAFSPGPRRIVMPDGSVQEDYLVDDTALAFRSREGLVIITGCAHSGVCNTVEHATKGLRRGPGRGHHRRPPSPPRG